MVDLETKPVSTSPERPPSGRLAVGILIVLVGVALLLAALDVDVPWRVVLPAAVIAVGVILLAASRSRMYGGLIVLGAILTLLTVASLGFDGPSWLGEADNVEQRDFSVTETVREIVLVVDSGSVEVVAGGSTVEVSRELQYGDEAPSVSNRLDGDVLVIEADCGGGLRSWFSSCRVDHVLTVPAAAAIDVETGSGSIEVDGLEGSVTVHSGSGGISLSSLSGDVEAETGSGTIEVDAVSGSFDGRTGSGSMRGNRVTSPVFVGDAGSGSINIQFEAAPQRVDLATGSGSVTVTVPAGAYRLDLQSSSGSTSHTGITDDPSASRTIDVQTGSGSIRVSGT